MLYWAPYHPCLLGLCLGDHGHVCFCASCWLVEDLKVHLSVVTFGAWDDLHKKLQAHGYVHVLAGEALQEQRKRDEVTRASKMRRAEMLSDVESMLAGTRELAELHGVGGKGTKRRRFARVLGRCLDRSSRVAAYNLREAEEENPDLSDDAD